MNKRITYVTGAHGSIGSKLIPSLKNAVVVEGDILSLDFERILKPGTALVHLAALSNLAESHEKPEEYYNTNVNGLKRVVDACYSKKVKLLFISTVHVYGCPGPNIDELCTKLTAFTPYGATKIAGEQYIQELGKKGLQFTIFRWPGTFGYSPAMHFDTALNRMVSQAVKGERLTIWRETWKKKRPHLYIGDAIEAILFILDNDIFNDEVYNVITGNYTVEETVGAIKEFIPDLKIKFIKAPSMNPDLDISDAKIRALGFRPKGNLKRGINEIITSLKS